MGKKLITLHLAVIEVTSICNLHCKHCYGFFNKKEIISINDFTNICSQLKGVGVSMITLSGGEPLILGPDIRAYINCAKKYFKEVNITSNGTLIDSRNIHYLKTATLVQISIDGPSEIHDSIRGSGVYNKAISAIELLKEHGIRCSLMMTVSDFNSPYVKEMHSMATKLGVPLGFERITNVGRGKKYATLSRTNFASLIKLARKYSLDSTDPIMTVADRGKRKYLCDNMVMAGCMAGNMAIAVDAGLNILPCVRLRIKLGNLRKNSLEKILIDSEIVHNLQDRDKLLGKCQECNYRYICGGCRAAAFANNNNFLSEDPGCFIK